MAWTTIGNVSVTNNNAIVYGSGTSWSSSNLVRGGDIFKAPDGKDYQVLSVQSNTQLTLASVYLGTTASAQAYSLIHTGLLPAELAVDVSDLQSKYLTTVSQLYEWETSTAESVPMTNPATGYTTNITPLGYLIENLPGDFIAARNDAEDSKNAAITAAATAENYAELAIEAWSASTEPNETLATISKTIHSGAIVKSIIYDVSKDSDPTWPDRCTHTSWYNETLGFTGKWLGQVATTAAAWATAGAAAGDGFQNTTDKKYYVLTGTSTATEIFRGNVRGFPAKVAIVAESGRVVIYDLTQAGCPMWMVAIKGINYLLANTTLFGADMQNGVMCVGTNDGLYALRFIEDMGDHYGTGSRTRFIGNIASRNTSLGFVTTSTVQVIVNSTVNDVAITVLPTAPTDPATGMPVPTIYAFTLGGVSRIADNGTVSSTASAAVATGWIEGEMVYASSGAVVGAWQRAATLPTGGASAINTYWTALSYAATTIPALWQIAPTLAKGAQSAVGHALGLTHLKSNPATPAKGMVAYLTNAFNSGWLCGDIKRAWLADTVAETVTASGELVTNGTFETDTSGWTAAGGAVLSVSGGALVVTNDGTGTSCGKALQSITTVVGKTYSLSVSVLTGTSSLSLVEVYSPAHVLSVRPSKTATTVYNFVAGSKTSTIAFFAGTVDAGVTMSYDNISVKLAEPDRSVKNSGLIAYGTLTKNPVATGSQLVSYSGFSAANYMEQPYSADLDFGTGDFCVVGWVNLTSLASAQMLVNRESTGVPGDWSLSIAATTGLLAFSYRSVSAVTSSLPVAVGVPSLVGYMRQGGKGYFFVNTALQNVDTAAGTSLTSTASAVLRLGVSVAGAAPILGFLALWRIGAGAPSTDQIAKIYRDEIQLFQPNAKCTIDGTSTAVAALDYDEDTDLLHVGTSWGRSTFKDLLRVESEATTVGSTTSLSASGGAILTGGTSAKIYQPALSLREELARKDEATAALGSEPVFFDYDATAGQTAFPLPKGFTTKAVYLAGSLKRLGATKDYTLSSDGFAETVTFGVAPGAAAWVSIMTVRA